MPRHFDIARRRAAATALALLILLAGVAATRVFAGAVEGEKTEAGTVISNRAEATYSDADGIEYGAVSPSVSVTVIAVAAVAVTPDETEPSAAVSPNERITRLFQICNAGNTPDFFTVTRAEASAPAAVAALFFDTDASGTLTDADHPVQLNSTMSPRVARGACTGLFAVVETNASQPNSRLTINVTARSNVSGAGGGMAQDDGTIINTVGSGARLTSPDDAQLPPRKLVENRDRITAAYGQALNYLISFRNSGDVAARRLTLRDDLPAELEYVPNSLRLGGRALSDASDADEGKVTGQRVEILLAEVAVGEVVQLALQARVRAGVAPGRGVVNVANVSAENAANASTTNAVAVVNPFGLVYEGRSGGGETVSGARVWLLKDAANATPLELTRDAGTTPNEANENPFLSDGQGRWSFALAPDQLGTIASPARYFLNVTAQGYRARMIEVTITPQVSSSAFDARLFTVTVKSLDGQPIARDGSFELTEEDVLIQNLAAFAMNVPVFENSTLDITKMSDRSTAEIGDVVSYRIEVHNATSAALNDVEIRDVLPASFHYAEGTARVGIEPAAPRAIEPENSGSELLFRIGELKAGARAIISYRVRVGANAREGEQHNTAVASGVFLSGERAQTAQTRATVRVRRGVFSTQQIIVGRVFEDENANGLFDKDERPMAGVRLYLNNGQSVLTDSAGQYNFPSVGDGALVVSLDPLTLPPGYAPADTNRRDAQTWSRLLRTPLGGGALLRQNFALKITGRGNEIVGAGLIPARPDSQARGLKDLSLPLQKSSAQAETSAQETATVAKKSDDAALASGTYEMTSTEIIEPVAEGAVRVISPRDEEVVGASALEVEARVAEGWEVALEVEGARVADSKIGVRRVDHKNKVSTFTFVGINLRPGPNRIKATAVSAAGARGQSVELVAYGRGPAKRLEIVADKKELSAGGRDQTTLRVRAFDEWNHPAADSLVALETSAGRLVSAANEAKQKVDAVERKTQPALTALDGMNDGDKQNMVGGGSPNVAGASVALVGGEGVVQLISDNNVGVADVRATTGAVDARTDIRITAEVRPSILVGMAQVTVGAAAPEMTLREDEGNMSSRIAFFYKGQFFGDNLLTLAYDSQRPLNRTAGRDRLFQLDPLERAYPLFGDSSTRYEDAQSNSKLYARLDRGRSFFLFGDFETEHKDLSLAGYSRKLTGVKAHVENSNGDYVSVTGARPDTAFARDVFAGGGLGLARLSRADILPGSEQVFLEVRDRRNPEVIIKREPLARSIDYNLDPTTGQIFFLRPISSFDFALNLVQVVVTYEHRANDMSSAVYTGRAVKNFEGAGLKLGLSVVSQKQGETGTFTLGGIDAQKKLPRGGSLEVEYAMSRGAVAFSGNLFGSTEGDDNGHNGSAVHAELHQPLPFKDATLRANFSRAGSGFLNPFGATVTPGSQRANVALDMKVRRSSALTFGYTDERNRTDRVNNRRSTGSVGWTETWNDRLRTALTYDFRRFTDDTSGRETNSNLITAGVEYQATDKLHLSVKREQNLGEADPTYPNQTTLAADYQWNQWAKLFFTQRLASAPITPISDGAASGFFASGARRETAIGIETRLWRNTNLVSRYQLENGINGSDSFAVIGLQNRLPISKELAIELGYERGFHLAGEGESFNSATLGFSWQPTENFRSSARYELRDRNGLGNTFTLGAAGRVGDNMTTLARLQYSRASLGDYDNSSLSASAALAWRPVESDRYGLLFSYTHRSLSNAGAPGLADSALGSLTRERSDVISSDGYMQATRNLELYGRFALKFGHNQTPDLAGVSSLTYLAQGRAAYRLGRFFDAAGEMRFIAQPASRTSRASYGAELGFWALPDLRLGGGYNFTDAREPGGILVGNTRRGFYFSVTSKLSNLFDLFGTSQHGTATTATTPAATTTASEADQVEGGEPK